MKILGISGGTKNGANDCMCKEALLAAKEPVSYTHLLYWLIKKHTSSQIFFFSIAQNIQKII